MAIESHPVLGDSSPFPTLFWLTCPILVKRVARLESEGWMSAVNDRLGSDRPLVRRLSAAIDRYRERRDGHEVIEDQGVVPGGGPERIKCVHAHLGHELSDPPNPIGALALSEAGWPDCREACFRIEMRGS